MPTTGMPLVRRLLRYAGTFVPMVVYVSLNARSGYATEAVPFNLYVTLAATAAYVVLARALGELKPFDLGFLALFAAGALAARLDVGPVLELFRARGPVLLFATLGLTAVVPLLLGREPFTVAIARRRVPVWKQRLPSFLAINRALTAYWALLFFAASAVAAVSPLERWLTVLFLNVAVFGLGLPAMVWLPPLYLRLFPAPLPDRVEGIILGMPGVFDARAAGDEQATIQFHVTGEEAADYVLQVGGRRARSYEGRAEKPDLTIDTPGEVWRGIARGELNPAGALAQRRFAVEGDLALLLKLRQWFPARRRSA
jgi:putative sterol carrier protein